MRHSATFVADLPIERDIELNGSGTNLDLERPTGAAAGWLDTHSVGTDISGMGNLQKAGSTSGHERGKAKRRQLILDAARQILFEKGESGLTIREIASIVGVSPVTIYNLFGSKFAVLRAIFEDDLNSLNEYFEANASDNSLEKIFDFTDLSTKFYQAREDYYRALFGILDRNSTSEVAISDWSTRSRNVQMLLDAAVAEREFRSDTPVDVLSSIIIRMGRAVSQEWANGMLTAEQSRTELGISMHTILSPYIAEESQERMAAIAKRYSRA